MARKKKNKVREGGQKRRTVCHAKAIRKNAQKNRAVGAAPGRELGR